MITIEELSHICSVFNKYGVRYVIIGGCAVILHGLERTTMDIDLIIDNSAENIEKIKNALSEFLKENELKELTPQMLKKYRVVRIGLGDFYIDLLTQLGDIDYEIAQKDACFEKVDNVEIAVASLDTMITLKQGFREIDVKDRLFLVGKKEFLERKKK